MKSSTGWIQGTRVWNLFSMSRHLRYVCVSLYIYVVLYLSLFACTWVYVCVCVCVDKCVCEYDSMFVFVCAYLYKRLRILTRYSDHLWGGGGRLCKLLDSDILVCNVLLVTRFSSRGLKSIIAERGSHVWFHSNLFPSCHPWGLKENIWGIPCISELMWNTFTKSLLSAL